MTTPTKPMNEQDIKDSQTTTAKKAMDGITPSDINQDKLPSEKQVNTDDSLLDMMDEMNKPEA